MFRAVLVGIKQTSRARTYRLSGRMLECRIVLETAAQLGRRIAHPSLRT